MWIRTPPHTPPPTHTQDGAASAFTHVTGSVLVALAVDRWHDLTHHIILWGGVKKIA